METKAVILKSTMKNRKDKAVVRIIRDIMKITIDYLYDEGYLDPEHDVVELNLRVKTDVPD